MTETLANLALIDLVIALFNLITAFLLDGWRVLRAYLWHRHGGMLRATKTASQSGIAFMVGLMGPGVVALFQRGLVAT